MAQNQVSFSPSSIVYKRKLSQALRSSQGPAFINRYKDNQLSNDDKILVYNLSNLGEDCRINNFHININIYPAILRKILNSNINIDNKIIVNRLARLLSKNIEIQSAWMFRLKN